jgi:predicted nucleic acid-binding protein
LIVIADSSGLLATLDVDAAESGACKQVLREAGTIVISPLVLAEVDHIARRFGPGARDQVLAFVLAGAQRLRFHLPEVNVDTLERACAVRRRFAALDLDLVDCVNVVLAAEYSTDAICTLDFRDFRAITPLTAHKAFRLLPGGA